MEELSLWKILVLAVIQGITEFLPVSSSGHLVIAMPLLCGGETPAGLAGINIVLHVGTLFSILVYYWQRIWKLLIQDHWTIVLVIAGTIPAVVFGLLLKVPLKKWAEPILESPLVAGCMLFVTGGVLLYLGRCKPGTTEYSKLSLPRAFVVGLSQAAAILPGLSRSGSTIASGVGLGMTRASAATFSFLLALPVIAGAGVLEAKDWLKGESVPTPAGHLILGMLVAFAVGYVSLWSLNRWLERGKLHYFAWYCFALGSVVLIWQLSRTSH